MWPDRDLDLEQAVNEWRPLLGELVDDIFWQQAIKQVKWVGDPCVMCGEPLGVDDLLPYHTKRFNPLSSDKVSGKDCTPSCMWCAKGFETVELLEAHEDGCRG